MSESTDVGAMLLKRDGCLTIVKQLCASQWGSLCVDEIVFRSPDDVTEDEIRRRLDALVDEGVVVTLDAIVDDVPEGMPEVFFAASPSAVEWLRESGVWESLGVLHQVFAALDRPDRVREVEEWEGRPGTPDWLFDE